MVKFFYVRKDATETMAFPVHQIRSIVPTGAADLDIILAPLEGATGTANVRLSVTEGKMDVVIKAILRASKSSRALVIAIADKVTGKYLHSAITDVEVTSA